MFLFIIIIRYIFYIQIYVFYIFVYVYIYIYVCFICVCPHIVTDLHFGANITPKEVLSVCFCFLTNQHLEPEIWEVLTVCSKILENVVLSVSRSLYSNRFTHQRSSIHPARNHMWDHTEQNADVRCRDILCPKQKFELGELKTYNWVDCVGYRRVFCKELKIPKKMKKYNSKIQNLNCRVTGWLCIYFASWFLLFKMNMGLALWLILKFAFFLYFVFLKFWVRCFFVFCIFEKLHSY